MHIVLTTIQPPTRATHQLADRLRDKDTLWVIGDKKGPASYKLPHTRFYPLAAQQKLPFDLARILPENSYARKNLGYLLAVRNGADCIVETDDDNLTYSSFFEAR